MKKVFQNDIGLDAVLLGRPKIMVNQLDLSFLLREYDARSRRLVRPKMKAKQLGLGVITGKNMVP